MKSVTSLVCISILSLVGCNSSAPTRVENSNTFTRPNRSMQSQNTIAHTTENQPQANSNSNGGRWSASGDPIDTTRFDKAIADAERALKADPSDTGAKKTLAQAYYERGFALTEARQYASALGDFRRALKLDPEHPDAKSWMDQIINIYAMLKKEYPKEGEEPPPLPLQKTAR